jgi:hypothetical protein
MLWLHSLGKVIDMTDEKYVFQTDCREKKRTASGAFHKRTHAGKGGAVKFPSDYMTRKELNAMNGEPKSYNLNSPMTWAEFKELPDDIKVMYIKLIREKFRVSDSTIFRMMGVSQAAGQRHFAKLGLGMGKGGKPVNSDMDGWCKWINGIKEAEKEGVLPDVLPELVNQPEEVADVEAVEESVEVVEERTQLKSAVPEYGQLDFECNASAALQMVDQILQDANVKITVVWKRLGEGVRCG